MEEKRDEYGPVGTSIVFENDLVRVWEVLLEPGEKQELHQHELPYAAVAIKPGNNRITNVEGETRTLRRDRVTSLPGPRPYPRDPQRALWRAALGEKQSPPRI